MKFDSFQADGSSLIPAIPPGVTFTTLGNGLTVIIKEDHSAPVVSAQAWCKTGSIDEGKWLGAGLSHVLEHMLFKGTHSRKAGRIDQEVQDAGGYMNAYTSFDRTVYYINAPSTGSKVVIDILCDIMQHATLPSEELAKELDVIRREMDMGQDDPSRRSGRRLFECAYTRSPYRYTIIGYPDIFNQLKSEDIKNYYKERYIPNNMFFVVVGDINPAEVVEQIKKGFAGSPAKALPPAVLPTEPTQVAGREIIEEAPIELGHAQFSWHIPDIRHPHVPALDVLATLLGSGRSSRLYREVREKKGVAHSVDAWTYNPGNPGLFGISAIVDGDKLNEARAAILAEVTRLQNEPVPAEELNKVVKQFIAGTLSSKKTMQGQAQDLGSNWMAANDLNFSERYLAAVKKLTPATLMEVARSYVTSENLTLYALLPEGSLKKESSSTVAVAENGVKKFTFGNGLTLLVKEDHRLPFVDFRMLFRGGVLCEDTSNSGITQLTARMLLQGTKTRTADQLALEIESVGGSIDSYGGNNSFGIHAEVLNPDTRLCLDTIMDVAFNPIFPEAALDREKQIQIAGIRGQRDQMLQSASKLMRKAMYGETGYGLDSIGLEESIIRITRAEMIAFHAKMIIPNGCVLSIFGDIDATEIRESVEKHISSWEQGNRFDYEHPSPQLNGIKEVIEHKNKKQAVVILGFPGTTIFSEDRFALELLQESCSDLGSRLFLRIREQLGLAYYVGAQNLLGLIPGYFAFYAGTSPEKVEQVTNELLKEVTLLRESGLTEEELARSKAKIIGQKKIAQQDIGAIALVTALDELYGLGYSAALEEDQHYEAVTQEQLIAVTRRYLDPKSYVVSVVRPEPGMVEELVK
ncbi:MAG: Peptidase inactive domain protein [Verrucomicrobiales bacterium]|nr:Peptidase inactive domain protein [Verrucomicrobiales bacterium]